MKNFIYNPDINYLLKEYFNEQNYKLCGSYCYFLGIGLGVKRYVQG
ncbi:hypothetical protein B4077_3377 [Bacillus cereus]|uniref:Uncharacterized protein n=1 Tax=Bacillus cereus TaxID=1396 RepID=A0A0G8F3Z5_BACCE|nr:hypothetical protein B4077_3377 [Bacillus cereus]